MSGANGIGKKALWNRENQFQPLQSYGAIFSEANLNLGLNGIPTTTFPVTPVTADQLMSDWVITSLTPLALTAPVNTSLNTLLEKTSKYQVGNSFTVTITNFDGAQHTMFFPGGGYQINPNPLVIPPLSKGTITIELIGIPCHFQVVDVNWGVINNTNVIPALPPAPGPVLPLGNNAGDLLEWDGAAWNPTDPTLNNTTPALLNQISPFPTPTATPFQKLQVLSGLGVNGTPAAPVRPFSGVAADQLVNVSVPLFNSTSQAGVAATSLPDYDAQNAALIGDAMYLSDYSGTTSNLAALGSPNSLWHFLGLTNTLPFGLDIGGQMFATSFTVMSDRRLKKNIHPVSLDSRLLRKLFPSRFQMLGQADTAVPTLGLIADEVEQVIPEAVQTMGNEARTKNLGTIPLVTALLAFTKDLEARVTELEKKK